MVESSHNQACKKLKCPECKGKMECYDERESILKMNIKHTYYCENCSGKFEVKRIK